MKLIHTSDWHIGRLLYGRKRYAEFEAFLDWLAATIEKERIDALLVAGDVFDTSAPANRAQEIYYRFLCRVAQSACRHVIVTAGNHDSPTFLEAPREVLRFLNVHVVGSASECPADHVLVLPAADGSPELIVCAVPYLRDRDIRKAEAGESVQDKERKLVEGIRTYYEQVVQAADQVRADLARPVPIVAMGHLFAAGGRTVDGDGVRELYVGSLTRVATDVFPERIDYLALGHLHVPQHVGGSDTRRYSGSPLPIGFGEASQQKLVLKVDFCGSMPTVTGIFVPRFQELERIYGNWDTIARRLDQLKLAGSCAWLEIVYEGENMAANLRERLDEAIEGTDLDILRVKNNRVLQRVLGAGTTGETLADLDVHEVFMRCLDAHGIDESHRLELLGAYRETLASFHEDDLKAE